MHQWNVTAYATLSEVTPDNLHVVWDSGTSDTTHTHVYFGKLRIAL